MYISEYISVQVSGINKLFRNPKDQKNFTMRNLYTSIITATMLKKLPFSFQYWIRGLVHHDHCSPLFRTTISLFHDKNFALPL